MAVCIFSLLAWDFCAHAQTLVPAENGKGKYGYVNEQGEKVISYKYKEAYPFEQGIAKVKQGDNYGFINEKGKSVGKIKYSVILPFTGNYCRVAVGGKYKDGILSGEKWGFLNREGVEILKPEYDEIGEFEDGIAYVIKGGKYGLIREEGGFLLEPKYAAVGLPDSFGNAWFCTSGKVDKKTGVFAGSKYGIINVDGTVIAEPKYRSIGYFYSFEHKGEFIDDATSVIDAAWNAYPSAAPLNNPLSRLYNPKAYQEARYNQFVGTIQPSGDSEDDTEQQMLEYANKLKEGNCTANENYFYFASGKDKPGVINRNGSVVVPEKKFLYVGCPSDGMAVFGNMKKGKMQVGFYDMASKMRLDLSPKSNPSSFREGLAKIADSETFHYYFINKKGVKVTDDFLMAKDFNEGICLVQSAATKKYGAIDNTGKAVIPLKYSAIGKGFFGDILVASNGKKWGAIDRKGQTVIPFDYQFLTDYEHGVSLVKSDGKWGILDKENHFAMQPEWENMKFLDSADQNYVWVMQDSLWHCYDRSVKSFAFEQGFEGAFNFNENNLAYVLNDDKFGVIDITGFYVVPPVMEELFQAEEAILYMQEIGKNRLGTTDAYRFMLRVSPEVNSHSLGDTIPETDWDY